MFSGFVKLYWMLPDTASHQEYTTGANLSRNSSKLETRSSPLISFILSSSRLLFPLTSPISVRRFRFSGFTSANSNVLLVCVIVSIGAHSLFIFSISLTGSPKHNGSPSHRPRLPMLCRSHPQSLYCTESVCKRWNSLSSQKRLMYDKAPSFDFRLPSK